MTRTSDTHPAQPSTAIVTVVAKNYLAQARVLMASIKKVHPEYLRIVLLVDRVEDCFDPAAEDFIVASSEHLDIPKSPWFHFKYSVLELSTAVKPFFLSWAIRKHNLKKIIYLDPDIRVYASLCDIEEALDNANILLTPHLTDELNDDRQPSELQILRTGTYNLGFIGVKAGPEVDRFLRWWMSHLYDHCVVDLARGFFVDQRWVDLVPGLFAGVRVLRDVGYNVAYWNAATRRISWRDGVPFVNDRRLCFFHFSGYNADLPDVLSKHQDRLVLSSREDLKTICELYRQELLEHGFSTASKWTYTHSRFANGYAIPDVGRHLIAEAPHLVDEIEDPFSPQGFDRIVQVWNTPISRSSGRSSLTKLAYRVYRLREDVQAAMPDVFGTDYVRFLEWMLSSAPHEHLLSEPFLRNIRTALDSARSSEPAPSADEMPMICADLLAKDADDPVLTRITKTRRIGSPAVFNEMEQVDRGPARLTVLARYIYESRPDLQRVFPDPLGRDAVTYLTWLLNYGWHSYGLTEEYLAPLRQNLKLLRSELRLADQIRADAYGLLLKLAFRVGPLAARVRNFRKRRPSIRPTYVAKNTRTGSPEPAPSRPPAPFGTNVYGYFRAEMGIGQSARNAIDALTAAGIPYSVHNLKAPELSEKDRSIEEFSESADYGVSLFVVNADQTEVVHNRVPAGPKTYSIGMWAWELDELPREWDGAFRAYDEIWVPSGFVQSAVAARAPIPVIRIPYCVPAPTEARKQRGDFGIDPDTFVFLTVFDMRSCFDRKNPLGVLRAFKAAFPSRNGCELIVKVNHADADSNKLDCLRSEAATGSIRLIEDTFRREDVVDLIRSSDCVVSLHRSEGFGLVLGEAMLLEKPVIATAYSGNMDFTTPSSAFLVPYELREVGPGNYPYPPHCVWADPCLKDASEQMKVVYNNPELRARRAVAGRKLMEEKFSAAAVGATMMSRLRLIEGRG
jgi:glycosyltransferase involved in cell wall biosynthesis